MERATEGMTNPDAKPLSPRERFLAERDSINKANAKANGEDEDEEILDAAEKIEKTLDKNMGQTSIPATKTVTMTKEQYLERKTRTAAQEAIRKMQQTSKNHLTEDEDKRLQDVLHDFDKGIITDPVLTHLMTEKIKTTKEYMLAQVKIKELQDELMKRVTGVSNQLIKLRGVVENTDRQILDLSDKILSKDTDTQ